MNPNALMGFENHWCLMCIGKKRTEARLERKRESAFHGSMDGTHLIGDLCLVLSADPKPQLRWMMELHDRFVGHRRSSGGRH